jgi:hypothetical protein
VVSTEYQGHRVVAVGNRLHFSTKWKTFADFLFEYALRLLGKEWCETERAKPPDERHPAMRWYDALISLTRRLSPGADGLYQCTPDEYTEAFLLLAYDLYVLRNLRRLQEQMLLRLRDADQFQGARYELFVAATCCKAGMDLDYEDETDKSTKHPEFRARDRVTGEEVFVEAKSRRWSGFSTDPTADANKLAEGSYVRRAVRRLLKRALDKPVTGPYAVFLDLNLPTMSRDVFGEPWLKSALDAVVRTSGSPLVTKTKFNLLVLTNFTLGFCTQPSTAGAKSYYGIISPNPQVPMLSQAPLGRLYDAVGLSGRVPVKFPED